jgi:predicted anti-sigma-YlaC factor YlaD
MTTEFVHDPTEEMSCQELVTLVTEYFEGAMSDGEVRRFDEHLAGCVGCRRYLDQMRRTISVLGQLREDDVSPEARDRLLAVFRTWKQVGGERADLRG